MVGGGAILAGVGLNVVLVVALGVTGSFVVALALVGAWAFVFSVGGPLRQVYQDGLISSGLRGA
jgi:hypothetical protein